MFLRKSILLFLAVLCLSFASCDKGPNTASVYGVVTVDGQPHPDVEIVFTPKDGQRPSVGYTNGTGAYTLRFTQDKYGCIPGSHVVRINAYRDPENDQSQYLPAKYNKEATENPELNLEIKKGKQKLDFDVKLK
ncbi:MAG: carboxypeptidase-like regulatory domain-containing protein [Planctomycetaceae bacterium]|jgi:hypothetical protein|nr:carboxypeptidase-like regulatory domain-containing protein [Planctomycetaceae bacterium]